MACFHPLKGFVIGVTDSGKKKLKIVPYGVDHLEVFNNSFSCPSIPFVSAKAQKVFKDFVVIPCGQCIGCRIEYSRQWANRCMMEAEYHKSNYFVTLTYDDEHVPKSFYGDPETGEACESLTLVKRDFQLFMKRLRRYSGQNLRFYGSGEYGTSTARPHYHAVIFGLELDDLVPYKRSCQGYQYYNSAFLQKCWPNGYVVVGAFTWETAAYVARYVAKKATGDLATFYETFNLQPEFSLMSRKPGIAKQYYLDHPEVYETDEIHLSTAKGGRSFRPPRYFDSLFDLDDPEAMESIKEQRRKMADALLSAKLSNTDLDYSALLQVEEQNFKKKINTLKRSEI